MATCIQLHCYYVGEDSSKIFQIYDLYEYFVHKKFKWTPIKKIKEKIDS